MDSLESETPTNVLTSGGGFSEPLAVERRLFRSVMIVIAAGTMLTAALGTGALALGTLLGGLLSVVNLRWLAASLRGIFELNRETGRAKTPPGTLMKFVLRWFLIGGVGYGASLTGFFSSAGIVAGLLAPAAAVLVEACYCTYKTLINPEAV